MALLGQNKLPLIFDVDRGPRLAARAIVLLTVFLALIGLVWAHLAKLDITVFGHGRVVPSTQLQVVQNLEGGIVSKLHVKQGDLVSRGQVLIEIDSTGFASAYEEQRATYSGLLAAQARLVAEVKQSVPEFDDALSEFPDLMRQEHQLWQQRQNELKVSLRVLEQQFSQRQLARKEVKTQLRAEVRNLSLSREELELHRPLLERGATSKVEFLKLQREQTALDGKVASLKVALDRAEAEIQEAAARKEERASNFRSKAQGKLSEVRVRIHALSESLKGGKDRVERRVVRSPVDGVVNRMLINTIGGISRPGDDLVEIVPAEDSLIIDMRVIPADIGFIHAGQQATVRMTAFDSSIFGSLTGQVTQIGADTLTDEQGETFYQVLVKTQRNFMGDQTNPLPIIPGMVSEIHVTTGQRTLLDYIIKPITKLREKAFRER